MILNSLYGRVRDVLDSVQLYQWKAEIFMAAKYEEIQVVTPAAEFLQ